MNTSKLHGFAAMFASHPFMGVMGMVAGWVATAQPSGWPLCKSPDVGAGIFQAISSHWSEHAAMYFGMLLANFISVVVASVVGKRGRWVREPGKGSRCFILMSIGMMLGSVATGDQAIALARWLGISLAPVTMLAGILFAVLGERLGERGLRWVRRRRIRPQAWLRKGGLAI